MAGALSQALRCRVISAVDSGMSRNAAAERFGVVVSTAVPWLRAWRDHGRPTVLPVGGDKRSHRIESFGAVILTAIEAQRDITLVDLAELLHRDHAASFAVSTVWRFLDHHDFTFKKN